MSHTLAFVFPQWQGSGHDKALYYGAQAAKKHLSLPCVKEIDVSLDDDLPVKNGIIGYDIILEQQKSAADALSDSRCRKILTIGGDCSVEIAPVSYLNELHGGDLAVVWFDAHGDLNMPSSSPSQKFHGMPLRCLLGDGDRQMVSLCASLLQTDQVVMAGLREPDEPETAYIENNNVPCVSVEDINTGERLINVLEAKRYKHVYIHIDLDVLDPACFPAVMCPTVGGLTVDSLINAIEGLKCRYEIAGISLVEYVHVEGVCEAELCRLLKACEAALL